MCLQKEDFKNFFSKKRNKIILGTIGGLLLLVLVSFWGDARAARRDMAWGVTFSLVQAERLGLDSKEVYESLLEDLRVDHIRLPVYWDRVETIAGAYDFSETDFQLREAMKRGVSVSMVLGERVPRWPECFPPEWAKTLPKEERQARVLELIEKIVLQYRGNDAVKYWQVENEPLLNAFGECPPADYDFLKREVALVRSLDSRPIVVTESGELSTWMRGARVADIVGTSMYRVVWSPVNGYFRWQIPAVFYRLKARFTGKGLGGVHNTELQAEPWVPSGNLSQTPLEEQYKSMNENQFRKNVAFAKKTGFPLTYLWGVEWWYWMKETQGIDTFWKEAKELWVK